MEVRGDKSRESSWIFWPCLTPNPILGSSKQTPGSRNTDSSLFSFMGPIAWLKKIMFRLGHPCWSNYGLHGLLKKENGPKTTSLVLSPHHQTKT